MSFEQLQKMVAAVSVGDPEGMTAILDGLKEIAASGVLDEEVGGICAEAEGVIKKILAGGYKAPERALTRVAELIERARGLAPEETAPAASEQDNQYVVELDVELMDEFIGESLDHLQSAEATLLELESNPEDDEALNAIFRTFHTIKGTASFLGLTLIQNLAHQSEAHLDRARNKEIVLTGKNADLALESADVLRKLVEELRGATTANNAPRESVTSIMERLNNPDTTAEPEPDAADSQPAGENTPAQNVSEYDGAGPAAAAQKGSFSAASADTSVRIGTAKLDGLVNKVGELVITHVMIAQNQNVVATTDEYLGRTVSQLGKIIRELQDLSLSMRMVPLKSMFQKMSRLLRDVAKKSGKSVTLITRGEDTEIDRNMVEELNDPLVHMIRNAVDHGIEPPEERIACGKKESGTVVLRASHTAGSVVIELEDDGRGLNREKILSKALSKGLITGDREYSDSEVFKLIFEPGFSTAAKVTDVSGRGVGMDVVRKNIEALRGRVEITSVEGKGSTFRVRVPLTLAIIDGMLLRAGTERYIIPTINVRQAFRPQKSAITTVVGKGEMVMFQGELLPVGRLSRIFGHEGSRADLDGTLFVVVEEDKEKCALAVDDLLGQHQVVIKSMGDYLGKVPGVSGAAILGDGSVGLILNVKGILSLAREGGYQRPAAQTVVRAESPVPAATPEGSGEPVSPPQPGACDRAVDLQPVGAEP